MTGPSRGSGRRSRADWLALLRSRHLLRALAQWSKAEADFKHALTLSPDQPFVLNYLGYSWADMGQNLAAGARR